jgi:hypothetical protein
MELLSLQDPGDKHVQSIILPAVIEALIWIAASIGFPQS